jgi:transketolase
MLAIPGMEVLIPGHEREVESLLRASYANGRPTYLRASMARNPDGFDVAPGRIEVIARGAAATIVAFGPTLWPVLRACEGLDVTLLYATSLRPFDSGGLAAAVGDDPLVITVEPFYEWTAAGVVTEALANVPSRFVSIGVPRAFIHGYGTREDLDADLGLDAAGIRRGIVVAIG